MGFNVSDSRQVKRSLTNKPKDNIMPLGKHILNILKEEYLFLRERQLNEFLGEGTAQVFNSWRKSAMFGVFISASVKLPV